MTGRRIRALIGAASLAGMLLTASVAWACSGVPQIRLSPAAGPAGTDVIVTGWEFEVGSPVEIRWGSVTGPVLATNQASELSFSVPVRIPNEGPGVYALVAVQTNGGRAIHKAPQIFELRSDASSPEFTAVSADLWGGFSPSASLAPNGISAGSVQPAPAVRALGAGLGAFGLTLVALVAVMAVTRRRSTGDVHSNVRGL